MNRAKEAIEGAQFRAKGKWYLAQQVDSFLEELSVYSEEDDREMERLEEEARSLRTEKSRLEEELQKAKSDLELRKGQSEEERQRRVCRELEQERDGLIEDIKGLRRFRENFREAVVKDAEEILERLGELTSQKLL